MTESREQAQLSSSAEGPDVTPEEDEAEESVDSLLLQWFTDTARVRDVAYNAQRFADEISSPYRDNHRDKQFRWAVAAFLEHAAEANRAAFERLFFQTVTLHHRGVEVLHPEGGPIPKASPFVRRMPDNQVKVEEERFQCLGRHVEAYETHIVASILHFQQACNAMIDGALCGDLAMVEDEFPKLAELATEVQKAYEIWSTIQS